MLHVVDMQVASAEEFASNVKGAGGSCELYIYEGAGHAFLNNPDSEFPSSLASVSWRPKSVTCTGSILLLPVNKWLGCLMCWW